jgi:Holliday junction DNA helicase RuvB
LRDRFGIPVRLDFYDADALIEIVTRAAAKLGAALTADGAVEIARRARGTPRVAVRLLRRVRDFADAGGAAIDKTLADGALKRLDVDSDGLDMLDRRYLTALVEAYGGGPVGVDTLAAALSEARDAIEDIIEPYLMQQGFIMRTPRGRMACAKAYERLGKKAPPLSPQQRALFADDPGED